RDEVRVMLHLGDDDVVAGAHGPADGLRDQIDALGGPPREHDLLAGARADERAHGIARRLVEGRRLLAQRVNGAMDVGVAPRVVLADGVDARGGFVAGRGRVQIHEGMAVDDAPEDGKVGPGQLAHVRHRATSLPPSALCITPSGSDTHFIRAGRMSASSRSRSAGVSSAWISSTVLPSASSTRRSADADAIAQLSPVNRASASRPSATWHSMRMRSPQSGFTPSKTAWGAARRPGKRGCRKRSRITSL